jgi:hypothetical protein
VMQAPAVVQGPRILSVQPAEDLHLSTPNPGARALVPVALLFAAESRTCRWAGRCLGLEGEYGVRPRAEGSFLMSQQDPDLVMAGTNYTL